MIDRFTYLIEKGKTAQGKNQLIKHLEGQKLTHKGAILAKCYECMGYYIDGKVDCHIKMCPLYNHMPFRGKEVDKDAKIEEDSGSEGADHKPRGHVPAQHGKKQNRAKKAV